MTEVLFLIALAVILQTSVAFDPKLNVTTCTSSQLGLTIQDAADGGIVYIQGSNTACKQYTHDGVSQHVFDVRACAVTWNRRFRVIVQRNPLYQTGKDKRFPIICEPDIGTIDVGNRAIGVQENEDEGEITKTVRPTASMSLLRNGVDITGGTVNMDDRITMEIQLDNEYTNDFDIEASDCYGEEIQIIKDSCPSDKLLFPKFTKVTQGQLTSTFGVFRPTVLEGGTVSMTFMCTLQVYIGKHNPKACDVKRAVLAKPKRKILMQADNVNGTVEEIYVGNTLLIDTEDISTTTSTLENVTTKAIDGCVQSSLFITLAVLYACTLLLTFVSCLCLYRKMKYNTKYSRRLVKRNRKLEEDLERMRYEMSFYEMDNFGMNNQHVHDIPLRMNYQQSQIYHPTSYHR